MTARDRPSQHGAICGEALADLAELGGVMAVDLCATCAFRRGCMTNQMAATGLVAVKCVTGADPDDFACHHGMKNGEPTKLCAGYLATKNVDFDTIKAAVTKMAARLDNLPAEDLVRTAFDEWLAIVDPDDRMDDYQRARAYERDSGRRRNGRDAKQGSVRSTPERPNEDSASPNTRDPHKRGIHE